MSSEQVLLQKLARLYGIQISYFDARRRRQSATSESLLAVLQVLGAPVDTMRDVPAALRQKEQSLGRTVLEPVTVAWDGIIESIPIHLPRKYQRTHIAAHLKQEDGVTRTFRRALADMPVTGAIESEGATCNLYQLPLRLNLPYGYHHLTLELVGSTAKTLIIAAPKKAFHPARIKDKPAWGIFLPLYALHSAESWGAGDYHDYVKLTDTIARYGGGVLASLPLLASFLDAHCEPSPYLPASRLLWNEFYLDVTAIPELAQCAEARSILASPSFQQELLSLRGAPLVDYYRQMKSKRRILQPLSQHFFKHSSPRRMALEQFLRENPTVTDYARFRAAMAKQGTVWYTWSELQRSGRIAEQDYDENEYRYHLYVQWLAATQFGELTTEARRRGMRLYLDLPLGTHPDGYDVWRFQNSFLRNASTGAPPDLLYVNGQDWAFPPPHPQKIREHGYDYFIAAIRHQLRHAGILRIDHIMGLHRLFIIPHGMKSAQGVYARYRSEEMYAILTLESHRAGSSIIGENLGIVPAAVSRAMSRHGLGKLYIVHYELAGNHPRVLLPPSANAIASLNNHDMPPFAGFWQGQDIRERLKLRILDEKAARQEKTAREQIKRRLATFLQKRGWLFQPARPRMVTTACLRFLAASRARTVLINLEDLWQETHAHNIPSTATEHPNWRRKARYPLETFCQMPEVTTILGEIEQLRQRKIAAGRKTKR